ncbi:MAG: cytochrome c biogenesis CcdA family protein, partial [Desulfatiglandales bacterium]
CALGSFPLIVAYVAGQPDLDSLEGTRRAFKYSVLFSLGLFGTLSLVGVACSILGRLLGDVGAVVEVIIGLFLIWLGTRLFMQRSCSLSLPALRRIKVEGASGALLVGGAYGVVAGPCTFGFVAPLLAVITINGDLLRGVLMIILFSLGHCLPLVLAGVFVGRLRAYLESKAISKTSIVFQRAAGMLILVVGVYFASRPIFG